MSSISPTATPPPSNFQLIFDAALEAYERETKKSLRSHPLFTHLQGCQSPETILELLKRQFQGLDRSQIVNEGSTHWLSVTVNVLYAFSATLGEGIGLVSPETFALGICALILVLPVVFSSKSGICWH